MTSDPTPAAVDLLGAARRGGEAAAVVELLRAWWRFDPPAALTDELALLDWVRSPEMVERLPWPQDTIVAPAAGGAEAIGHENQFLWEALLDRSGTSPVVRFVVDDGARRLEPSVPVGEFLLRVLVEAAVRSSERPVRCRPRQPEAVSTHLLAEVLVIEAGLVSFPALAAGVGWFGLIRGDGAHFVTQGSPSELPDALAGFGAGWEERVGEPSGELPPNPWEEWPPGTGQSWRPL